MTDTNGWSKSELYVMRKLESLEDGQASIDDSIKALRHDLSQRSCALHAQRLDVLDTRVNAHAEDLKDMKSFRAQIIGAAGALSLIGPWFWSKISKFF